MCLFSGPGFCYFLDIPTSYDIMIIMLGANFWQANYTRL